LAVGAFGSVIAFEGCVLVSEVVGDGHRNRSAGSLFDILNAKGDFDRLHKMSCLGIGFGDPFEGIGHLHGISSAKCRLPGARIPYHDLQFCHPAETFTA